MRTSIESKIVLGFVMSLIALAGLGWFSYRATQNLIAVQGWVSHTQETITTLESGLAILTDAETSQRGFLLTGDPRFLQDSEQAQQMITVWINEIRHLVANDPHQRRQLAVVEDLIQQRLVILNDRIRIRQQEGLQAAVNAVDSHQGRELMDRTWQGITTMLETEKNLLAQRQAEAKERAQASLRIILACGVLAAAVGLVAVMLIRRDLRLRAEAQEERDRFFDVSSDMLCTAGFDGYFQQLNPAWKRVLGWSLEELRRRPFVAFVHPDDVKKTVAETEKLAGGLETLRFENRYQCQDGSYRWLEWVSRPDTARRLIYASARDITEQKWAEESVLKLNAELQLHATRLEESNKELEAFSYSVSHDLRAPLRHIDGFVRLLEKQATQLDDKGRRYLGIITSAARQMGMLIDDLLVFSRMGRSEMHQKRVAMKSLVHEAMDQLQPDASGRNIEWQIGPLPEIEADAAMMRQVWVNLIANALKYSRPRDPAKIEIGCQDAGAANLVFYVRDNGVGFDMQYAHKLFGVFQRLHSSDEFEGTGIGLANVSRIVHRHGGRVWAEGSVNQGAAFYFSLPNTSTPPTHID